MTAKTEAPAIGLYEDVPFDEYAAWDLPSNTGLGKLARSPAHYKAWQEAPQESTPALVLGSLFHALVLGGEDRFAVAPKCDRRTKAGKEDYAEFAETIGDREVVTQDQYDIANAMTGSICRHPAALDVLDRCRRRELSAVAEMDGMEYKCRFDLAGGGWLADLKSTQDASAEVFGKSIYNFGYHRQAGGYFNAAEQLGLDPACWLFIAIEKTPPYAVAVYKLGGMAIDTGRAEFKRLLGLYYECRGRDEWPAYPVTVQDIELPVWAYSKIESAGNTGAWMYEDIEEMEASDL